ncbi:hypothetical protein, partial [Paraburkholderia sediminicola]|uniref:hypothetical protein n=2 Tax=Paraburkholderia sediminicola TaxID=458836 RepID=UPI0038B8E0E2
MTALDSALISNNQRQPLNSGGVGVKEISNDPSQQFVVAIDRMLGDNIDDVAQVGPGIKAIQFG